jgi:alpha-tubulin suppressor-like RCC1 family protein
MLSARGYVKSGSSVPWLWLAVLAAVGLVLGLVAAPAAASATRDGAGTTASGSVDPVAYINAPGTGVVEQMSAGGGHTCAVTTEGAAFCWGSNDDGQLGNGTTTSANIPVQVTGVGGVGNLQQVSQISAGTDDTTCAVAGGDSSVYCWGKNDDGQLGNGRSGDAAGSTVPVKTDLLVGMSQVSVGESHACAVATASKQAFCWGKNQFGQLGNDDDSGAQKDSPEQVTLDGGPFLRVTDISAGENHTCAVDDGRAFCWGLNSSGQLGTGSSSGNPVPPQSPRPAPVFLEPGLTVTGISAGGSHSCAVVSEASGNQEALCWGKNDDGQLGVGTTRDYNVPFNYVDPDDRVEGFQGQVTDISAGSDHTCAVSAGSTFCWGLNKKGQLGNGNKKGPDECTRRSGDTAPCSKSPVLVVEGDQGFVNRGVSQVTAGGTDGAPSGHTCAVSEGEAFCWGSNKQKQLGIGGGVVSSDVPVRVAGRIAVDPKSVEFGTVDTGDLVAEPVTVEHSFPLTDADVVVNITEKESAGDRDAREGFAFTPVPGCTNNRDKSELTLNRGSECSGELKFAPKAPGTYGGIVKLQPQLYPNAGTEFAASGYSEPGPDPDEPGPDPDGPVVKADAVDFGKVDVYTAKVETVKIKNTGDEPLKITGGKITSDPDDEFAADLDDCTDGKVAAGKSCTAKVQFFPRQGGVSAALLELKSNAVGSATIALTGEGLLPVQQADEDGDPVPPGKVRKLTAPDKKTTAKKAQVKWKKPKGEVTVTEYQTRIKKNGNWKKWSGKDPQPNLNNWISRTYKKLSPNTKYKVQVRAWSDDVKGPKDGLTFRTDRKGIPTKPGNG